MTGLKVQYTAAYDKTLDCWKGELKMTPELRAKLDSLISDETGEVSWQSASVENLPSRFSHIQRRKIRSAAASIMRSVRNADALYSFADVNLIGKADKDIIFYLQDYPQARELGESIRALLKAAFEFDKTSKKILEITYNIEEGTA